MGAAAGGETPPGAVREGLGFGSLAPRSFECLRGKVQVRGQIERGLTVAARGLRRRLVGVLPSGGHTPALRTARRSTNLKRKGLGDFLDFAGADTGCADAQPLAGAVDERANGLQVHVPTTFSDIMCVADAVAELGTAATNFANFRHKTEISLRILNLRV
jgi:hypothetical protein